MSYLLYGSVSAATDAGIISVRPPHPSVLWRMLTSPLALSVRIKPGEAGNDFIRKMTAAYIDRWCLWQSDVESDVSADISRREEGLVSLHLDAVKYNYAEILGGEFAPKASEIAVAILGPDAISLVDI
jgi:hypothetical protein